MTSIPDLIENWRRRRLNGDLSFGVLVDETIDLLTRLTAPGDEGLETTEEERADTSWPTVTGFVSRLLRDFDLLRAKLRAEKARADRYEAALTGAYGELALAKDMASFTAEQKAGCVERAFAFIAAALNQEPKP